MIERKDTVGKARATPHNGREDHAEFLRAISRSSNATETPQSGLGLVERSDLPGDHVGHVFDDGTKDGQRDITDADHHDPTVLGCRSSQVIPPCSMVANGRSADVTASSTGEQAGGGEQTSGIPGKRRGSMTSTVRKSKQAKSNHDGHRHKKGKDKDRDNDNDNDNDDDDDDDSRSLGQPTNKTTDPQENRECFARSCQKNKSPKTTYPAISTLL